MCLTYLTPNCKCESNRQPSPRRWIWFRAPSILSLYSGSARCSWGGRSPTLDVAHSAMYLHANSTPSLYSGNSIDRHGIHVGTRWVPTNTLLRIWDLIMAHGRGGVVRVALALLQAIRARELRELRELGVRVRFGAAAGCPSYDLYKGYT